MPSLRIACLGALAIVIFDLAAALAARIFGFPYAYATLGSWLIYACVGFLVARSAGVVSAAAAGAAVAFVEATLGWAVSWWIGPGRVASGIPSVSRLVGTVLLGTLIGAAIGALGGAAGHRPRGPDVEAS